MIVLASDNYAAAHPQVLEAMARVNSGYAVAYGDDEATARTDALFGEFFGPSARAALVWNGTGANVVSLRLLLRPWQAVVCAPTAHVATDECGAPEHHTGSKLLHVPAEHGRITPEGVLEALQGLGDQHRVQPAVVSITQSTELGTVYTPDEIAAIAATAHRHGLAVHLDGSRLSNAAASLGVPLRALTTDVGVDVVSFGGTKNGLVGAEAVVVLREDLHGQLAFVRKQSMQLASKMRYLAVQFEALLTDDLWLRGASHANAMAARLEAGVRDVPGVRVTHPVQANAVFATVPAAAVAPLQQVARFYEWDPATHEARWMCSWQTTPAEVDRFVETVKAVVPAHATC